MQSESSERSPTQKVLSRQVFQPGEIIAGRYKVLSIIGRGGMGLVYKVEQILLAKEFALKTIDVHDFSESLLRRFQHEARATFAVDHPNIISVYDFGVLHETIPYLVMEFVDGESLSERIKRSGALTIHEAILIFVQVAHGLSHAHRLGIVHRDVKPGNIMLVNKVTCGSVGSVKILDFGLAKFTQNECSDVQALTQAGELLGSPLYMSPEQCLGGRIDHRTDIYSLGCVMFQALTGVAPFLGDNAMTTMFMHRSNPVPSMKESSLGAEFPEELERVIRCMLEKRPEDRFADLAAVAASLESCVERSVVGVSSQNKPAQTNSASARAAVFRNWVIGAALIALSLAGLLAFFMFRPQNDKAQLSSSQPNRSNSVQRFQRKSEIDFGREFIVYQFPANLTVGTFRGGDDFRQVKGEVRFVKTDTVSFRPSEAFLLTPDNLGQFAPNDLCTLDLRQRIASKDANSIMLQIARLSGLQYLDISENEVGNEVLPTIERLRKLQGLKVSRTKIDGTALASLSNLENIKCIEFNKCEGASDLLKGLNRYGSIKYLFLNSCSLSANDFKSISRLGKLNVLSVNKTGVTDSDLARLSALPRLKNLEARDCALSGASIPAITQLARNGLEELVLSGQGFTQKEQVAIKRLVPQARFVNHNNRKEFKNAFLINENTDEDELKPKK